MLKDQANERRSSEPPHIASRDVRQRAADGPKRLAIHDDATKGRRQQQPPQPRGKRVIANVAAVRSNPAERKGLLSLEHPPRSASRNKHHVRKRRNDFNWGERQTLRSCKRRLKCRQGPFEAGETPKLGTKKNSRKPTANPRTSVSNVCLTVKPKTETYIPIQDLQRRTSASTLSDGGRTQTKLTIAVERSPSSAPFSATAVTAAASPGPSLRLHEPWRCPEPAAVIGLPTS